MIQSQGQSPTEGHLPLGKPLSHQIMMSFVQWSKNLNPTHKKPQEWEKLKKQT